MKLKEMDAINNVNLNLEYARCMANEINENLFASGDEKQNRDRFMIEYSRLQAFSFILLDYLFRVQISVDELLSMAEK